MCQLTKEEFTLKTPGWSGDILFEHLRILKQEALEKQTKIEHQQPIDYSPNNLTSSQGSPVQSYSEHYQPPSHLYPTFSLHQQHLYAGEQYHHSYGFQQPFVTIPPPPMHYYRQSYTVIYSFFHFIFLILIIGINIITIEICTYPNSKFPHFSQM